MPIELVFRDVAQPIEQLGCDRVSAVALGKRKLVLSRNDVDHGVHGVVVRDRLGARCHETVQDLGLGNSCLACCALFGSPRITQRYARDQQCGS